MNIREAEQRFRNPLLAFFKRRLPVMHEAEDLVQEVLLKISRIKDKDKISNPSSYIFRIASNHLADHIKRNYARNNNIHIDINNLISEYSSFHYLTEEIEPERILAGKDELVCVISALDSLPDKTRDIFISYRVDGFRRKEIAKNFGISVSAVEKHLAKAMACISLYLEASDVD